MEIKVTKKHKVTFAVEYFESTEGGMDSARFREGIVSIEEAITALELAQVSEMRRDWIITAEVTTSVSAS